MFRTLKLKINNSYNFAQRIILAYHKIYVSTYICLYNPINPPPRRTVGIQLDADSIVPRSRDNRYT